VVNLQNLTRQLLNSYVDFIIIDKPIVKIEPALQANIHAAYKACNKNGLKIAKLFL
jgi:hypothetical protein